MVFDAGSLSGADEHAISEREKRKIEIRDKYIVCTLCWWPPDLGRRSRSKFCVYRLVIKLLSFKLI